MQTSPYHVGELRVQQRTGETGPASLNGRNIAPHVPAPARGFVTQQDMVLLGTADPQGHLWATMVTGRSGFAGVSDDLAEVRVRIEDPNKVLEKSAALRGLQANDSIAMLFIELSTRRRLRVNGMLTRADSAALEMHVEQSYAACPKYIQRRKPVEAGHLHPVADGDGTDSLAALVSLIERADTLFIASAGPDGLLDVSHRGGRAGFAEWHDGALCIPDYAGNSMFNTLGNLEVDTRAGICIPDFERSYQWLLTGRACGQFEVEGTEDQTGGTLRRIKFVPVEWVRLPFNTARMWAFVDSSPFNP
ncbi:MAG: pyridoxamine 5'-phosphate oxidase family protein [Xanthomonadaceae bacterium]|nr:pyridoxamine 5'-phosphate oxidase family protein [Xanthomonadaceae bacterium]